MNKYKLFIDGQACESASGEYMESFNPFTGKAWAMIPKANTQDVDRAVDAAYRAFDGGEWPKMHPSKRGSYLRKLGDLISANADRLARVETLDNGKLLSEMSAQVHYVPQWFYYFGGLADKIEGSVIPIDKQEMFNFSAYEPLGVVAAITPWNSPLLIAAWKLAPALAAGNTVVLKPSEHASASSLELALLAEEAGFPKGVLNVITGLGSEIGDRLVSHPKVAKVTFTGGTETGRRVYEVAASGIKNVSLELGGKSPNIVFSDIEIKNAARGVISGIYAATGQTCIAGSRLLVEKSIHDDLVNELLSIAKSAKMGDPLLQETKVGPIATKAQYQKVLDYLSLGKREGATCVMGGNKAERPECKDGWFVEPTIFTGIENSMRIAQEEIFGPVLVVIPFDSEEEAVAIANDSPYGLAAGLWTNDMSRVFRVVKMLKAGTVWVNTYRAISYLSPFGGYKQSGFGRESGVNAIYEYLQEKCVWISTASEVPDPFIMRLK